MCRLNRRSSSLPQSRTDSPHSTERLIMINWRALDNVPVLLYILAAKTILLCLAFAGVKIYQSKREEAALKQQMEMKRKLAQQTQELIDSKKDD